MAARIVHRAADRRRARPLGGMRLPACRVLNRCRANAAAMRWIGASRRRASWRPQPGSFSGDGNRSTSGAFSPAPSAAGSSDPWHSPGSAPARLRLLPPRRLALRLAARVLAVSHRPESPSADRAASLPSVRRSDPSIKSPHHQQNSADLQMRERWVTLASIASAEGLSCSCA